MKMLIRSYCGAEITQKNTLRKYLTNGEKETDSWITTQSHKIGLSKVIPNLCSIL